MEKNDPVSGVGNTPFMGPADGLMLQFQILAGLTLPPMGQLPSHQQLIMEAVMLDGLPGQMTGLLTQTSGGAEVVHGHTMRQLGGSWIWVRVTMCHS